MINHIQPKFKITKFQLNSMATLTVAYIGDVNETDTLLDRDAIKSVVKVSRLTIFESLAL